MAQGIAGARRAAQGWLVERPDPGACRAAKTRNGFHRL